ncbi:putative ribonuclease H-like domain-containing protein [Tanacetum coccineum]
MGYFQIIRVDGSLKRYSSMIKMLQNIDREDLETLWKLVKAKHGLTRPDEAYEREEMDLETAQTTTTAKLPILKQGPVTTKEKVQKKNDVKARSMLLMALPNEHLITFNQYKDGKTLFAAIQTRIGGFRRLNKPNLDTMSFDDLYNNFKIVEQEVKGTTSSSSSLSLSSQNMAFVSFPSNTNEVNTAYGVSTTNTQLALLSMRTRRFFQKTSRKITINRSDTAGYNKSKVECFNCHKMRHFARECRGPRNQDNMNRNQDITRRTVNVEETSSKAMVAIDGADSEVHIDKTCSKTCLKSFETLKTQLDDLRIEFNKFEFNLATYKRGLAFVEEQLVFYKKNEVIFYKQLAVLKRDISYKDSEISMLKSKLEKLKQEKESNQLKIENFDNASKSLDKLIGSRINDKSRKGLGFVSYNAISPPHTGLFSPPNLDLSYFGLKEFQQPEFEGYGPKTSKSVSEDISNEVRESPDAPLVEELVSDDKLEKKTVFSTVAKIDIVRPKQQEKPIRKPVKYAEMYSFDHVQADSNYHQMERVVSGNNYTMVNYNYYTKKAHPSAHRNMASRAVLMRTGLRPLNNARIGHPQKKDQGYVDSGCSRHMTWNMSYLSDFKDFDRGYVTFGGGAKGGKITSKGTLKTCKLDFEYMYFIKLADKSQVLLKIPRKNNMYSVDMKNIVPKESLTCLVAKATLNESMLWHRSLGHNRVLVVKPHNKTSYELFRGRTPAISFMRPFGCHVTILNTLDYLGDGPKWLFDIDFLTKSMNYVPVVADTSSNNFVGTEESISAGHSSKETGYSQDYILMPLWKDGSLFYSSLKNVSIDEPQPSSDTGKKDDEGVNKESGIDDQERSKNSTQDVNTVVPSINTASINVNTGSLNINIISLTVTTAPLEAKHADFFGDETEIDISNITATYLVPSTLNTRIHKDHSLDHVIGRAQKYNPSIKRSNLDRSYARRASVVQVTIGLDLSGFTTWFEDPEFPDRVYKVEKALYGLRQAPRAWYETLSTYLLDNEFQRVTQKDDGIFISQDKYVDEILKKFGFLTMKTASTPMETSKPLMKDENAKDVDVHLYRSLIGSLMYLTSSRPDIMFVVCACARFQVTPKVSHLHAVKRIFRYLKGQPKLGLWYPKDSPFNLEAYTDSDYAGASLDRKSTIGGCQFLRSRLISWQCKKQTVVADSTTEAEYVAAASCCGQVLWIQNQMLDYGYNFMNTKIFIDN